MNLTLTVGLLLRKNVREGLDSLKFRGHLIDYIEHKHWFDSDFLLKGASPEACALIQKYIAAANQ